MTNPTLVTTPFAESGTKNTIPEVTAPQPQLATMQTGFPVITQTPIPEGGIPPERADFNGILNLYGQHIVHLNKGLPYEYDATFASQIGGYPLHARIMLTSGEIVQCTTANNTNDPNVNMTGWVLSSSFNSKDSISQLPSSAKNGELCFVKSYRSGWAATIKGAFGGGIFSYNSTRAEVNDGIHCFNGWERLEYNKYYINTDIAGFYGDGVNDDYDSFIRVKKYIMTLDYWANKTFEIFDGNYSIKHFDDDVITVYQYGLTGLITTTGNCRVIGAGMDLVNISYDFDYLAWMYARFTDNYVLKTGIISNPVHSTFAVDATIISHVKGVEISGFNVNYNGDVYFYSQAVVDEYLLNGKAFCSISTINWALNTIENIKCKDFKVIRNPSMQNIAFNNSREYTDNLIIDNVHHLYSGEASALLNKCPDHSSIYCNGKYTKVTNNKFVSSRSSTINCAIEFHGSGEISNNEFIDCAANIYIVNMHEYLGYFNEYFDNTHVVVKNNNVSGAIYGIAYANGGSMTIDSSDNTFKIRKEKSNPTWVDGKVFVHGGIDARGLINLNETVNSNTILNSKNDTFEQEEPTGWTTEDNYINPCVATKNIQQLNLIGATFKNFKGCILVLEKPAVNSAKPKINMIGNTYIDCGSTQDSSKPHLVTDSIVYISNANILDFSSADTNAAYGDIFIENETYVNCKYKRAITQISYQTLFAKASIKIENQGNFITPVSFVNPFGGSDSFTNYNFNMDFGRATPSVYGFGEVLKGYRFVLKYDFSPNSTERIYMNTCIKVQDSTVISTVSDCINSLSVVLGDKPNGISIEDRDSVYFPFNRNDEVQKLVYNSASATWS